MTALLITSGVDRLPITHRQRYALVQTILAGHREGMTPGELAEAIKPLMEQASHEIAVDVAHYWRELVAAVTTRARVQ